MQQVFKNSLVALGLSLSLATLENRRVYADDVEPEVEPGAELVQHSPVDVDDVEPGSELLMPSQSNATDDVEPGSELMNLAQLGEASAVEPGVDLFEPAELDLADEVQPGTDLLSPGEFTAEGYVCKVVHHPYALDTGHGAEGSLSVDVTSEPACQGTHVEGHIYSEGASPELAPELAWTYSTTTFNTLYQNLVHAAATGLKVVVTKATSGERQIRSIGFSAD